MEVTVITSIGWVSRRKLGDLTLSRVPSPAPRPRPLSLAWLPLAQIYRRRRPIIQLLPPARRHPPASAHQRPRSNSSPAWLAPPRQCLLCSQCLPKLLHALVVLSPQPQSGQRVAASTPRSSSMPRSVPPWSPARPGSSTPPPNHRPPSSTSTQCLSPTQLRSTVLDVIGSAASSGGH
jgi:hypothetical protein